MSQQLDTSSMLTSAEMLDMRLNFKPELPVKGKKEFEPSGSWLESKQLQCALDERKTLLQERRIDKLCSRSTAEWKPELSLALVTQRVGNFDVLGQEQGAELWINAEEILYLLEMNRLEVFFGGVPMSVQQGYAILLADGTGCTLDEYTVYKHLNTYGYRVLRHQKTNLTQYEVDIRLDQFVQRSKAIKDAVVAARRVSCDVVKERDVICVDSMPDILMEEDPAQDDTNVPSTSAQDISSVAVPEARDVTSDENDLDISASCSKDVLPGCVPIFIDDNSDPKLPEETVTGGVQMEVDLPQSVPFDSSPIVDEPLNAGKDKFTTQSGVVEHMESVPRNEELSLKPLESSELRTGMSATETNEDLLKRGVILEDREQKKAPSAVDNNETTSSPDKSARDLENDDHEIIGVSLERDPVEVVPHCPKYVLPECVPIIEVDNVDKSTEETVTDKILLSENLPRSVPSDRSPNVVDESLEPCEVKTTSPRASIVETVGKAPCDEVLSLKPLVSSLPHTEMSTWMSATETNEDLFKSGVILDDWEEKKAPSAVDDDEMTSSSHEFVQGLEDDDHEIIGITLERDPVEESSTAVLRNPDQVVETLISDDEDVIMISSPPKISPTCEKSSELQDSSLVVSGYNTLTDSPLPEVEDVGSTSLLVHSSQDHSLPASFTSVDTVHNPSLDNVIKMSATDNTFQDSRLETSSSRDVETLKVTQNVVKNLGNVENESSMEPDVSDSIAVEEKTGEQEEMPIVLLMNEDEELATMTVASPHKVAPEIRRSSDVDSAIHNSIPDAQDSIPTINLDSIEVTALNQSTSRNEEFIDYSKLPGFHVIISKNKCPVLVDISSNISSEEMPVSRIETISEEPSTSTGIKRVAGLSESLSSKKPRLEVSDDDITVDVVDDDDEIDIVQSVIVKPNPRPDTDKIIQVVSPDISQGMQDVTPSSKDNDPDCLELDIEGETSLESGSSTDSDIDVEDSDIEVVELDDSDIEIIDNEDDASKRKRPAAKSPSLPAAKRRATIELVNLSDSDTDDISSDEESVVAAPVTRVKYWTDELKQDKKRTDILKSIPNVVNKAFLALSIAPDMLPPKCFPSLKKRINLYSLEAVGYGGKPTRDYRPAHQVHEEQRLLEPILDDIPSGSPFDGQNCIFDPSQNFTGPFNNYNPFYNNFQPNMGPPPLLGMPFPQPHMGPPPLLGMPFPQPNMGPPSLLGMPFHQPPPLIQNNFPIFRPILRPRMQNTSVSGVRTMHSKPQPAPYRANGWFQQNNFFNRSNVNEVLNHLSEIKPLFPFPGHIPTPPLPTHTRWNQQNVCKVERDSVIVQHGSPVVKMEQDVKGNFPRFVPMASSSFNSDLLVKQEDTVTRDLVQRALSKGQRKRANKKRRQELLQKAANAGVSNSETLNPNLQPKTELLSTSTEVANLLALSSLSNPETQTETHPSSCQNVGSDQPTDVDAVSNPATSAEVQSAKDLNTNAPDSDTSCISMLISDVESEHSNDLEILESNEAVPSVTTEELRRRDNKRRKTYLLLRKLKLKIDRRKLTLMAREHLRAVRIRSKNTGRSTDESEDELSASDNESECKILSNESSRVDEDARSDSDSSADGSAQQESQHSSRSVSQRRSSSCDEASQPVSRSGSEGSSDNRESIQEVSSGSNEEEDAWPLVQPEDCIDYATIFSRLNIIKPASSNLVPSEGEVRQHRFSFDVYNPPVDKATVPFRKSSPGVPDYRIVVLSVDDPVPNAFEIAALTEKCKDEAPILFAVVKLGTVSFIRLGSVNLPVDLRDYSVTKAAAD